MLEISELKESSKYLYVNDVTDVSAVFLYCGIGEDKLHKFRITRQDGMSNVYSITVEEYNKMFRDCMYIVEDNRKDAEQVRDMIKEIANEQDSCSSSGIRKDNNDSRGDTTSCCKQGS